MFNGYSLNRSLLELKSIVGNVRALLQTLENATVITVQKQHPQGLI